MCILQLDLRRGDVGESQPFLIDDGFNRIDSDNVFDEEPKERTEDFHAKQ